MPLNQLFHWMRGTNGVDHGPIGLDLGHDRMHLVQLERHGKNGIRFRAHASLPYAGTRDYVLSSHRRLKPLLKRAFSAGPFSGRRVVTSLPSTDTRIMSITYDLAGARDDGTAVLQLMRSRLDRAPEEYVIDYLPIRSKPNDEQRLAVVAVARRERVVQFLDLLHRSGLEVDALEIGPAAIKRLVAAFSTRTGSENVLIINCGHSQSYLTMLSGRRLLLDQQVNFGEQQLIQRLCTELGMSEEAVRVAVHRVGLDAKFDPQLTELSNTGKETSQVMLEVIKPNLLALIEEVKRALRYVVAESRGEPVHRLYLMGNFASWRGSDRVLRRLIDIPVQKLPDPMKLFGAGNDNADDSFDSGASDLIVATGLALRGMIAHE